MYKEISSQDRLETKVPGLFGAFHNRFWIDEAYDASALRFVRWLSFGFARAETMFFTSISSLTALVALGFGWVSRLFDNFVIDSGFDSSCRAISESAATGRRIQDGRIQTYLRTIALTLLVLVLVLAWGCKG